MLSCRKQTAEMIKTAAQKPTERKEYIQKCLRDFAKLPEDPVVQAFKMSVDPNFLKVCLIACQEALSICSGVAVHMCTCVYMAYG